MGGQHGLEQSGARARETDQEDVRLGVGGARPDRRRLAPWLRVRRLEPGGEPANLVQRSLLAGRFEPRGVEFFQLGVGVPVSGECLGRVARGVEQVADQAEDNGPVDRRQRGIVLELGKPSGRGVDVALLQICCGQRDARQHVGRRQRQRPLAVSLRRGRIARPGLQQGEAREGFGIVAVQLGGPLVRGPRGVDVGEILQQCAAVKMGGRQEGIGSDCGAIGCQRALGVAQGLETSPKQVQDVRVLRRKGSRALEQLHRLLEPGLRHASAAAARFSTAGCSTPSASARTASCAAALNPWVRSAASTCSSHCWRCAGDGLDDFRIAAKLSPRVVRPSTTAAPSDE